MPYGIQFFRNVWKGARTLAQEGTALQQKHRYSNRLVQQHVQSADVVSCSENPIFPADNLPIGATQAILE